MKLLLKFPALVFVLAFAASTTAWSQGIRVDGSSTGYALSKLAIEEFQKTRKASASAIVGLSGTGGGLKKFCRGEVDISSASRPILAAELDNCKRSGVEFIELPVAYDAVVIVVNPRNTFVKALAVEELKKMWEPAAQGEIGRWKQVNAAWPDAPMKLLGPGPESGTFDYFSAAVMGAAKELRKDYMLSEEQDVLVRGVARDANALSYMSYSEYASHRDVLRAVPISFKSGAPIAPTAENVLKGSYAPLARPLFVYVNAKSLEKPEVREFAEFYVAQGARLARATQAIALPEAAYRQSLQRLQARRLGTAFGGTIAIGVLVDEVMRRDVKP